MENVLMQDCGDAKRRADIGCYGKGPVAKTASYTVSVHDTGTIFSNKGADGAVTFTLPAPKAGIWFAFVKLANQNLILQMPAGVKINGGSAAAKYQNVSAEADSANVVVVSLDGTNYHIRGAVGTWVAA